MRPGDVDRLARCTREVAGAHGEAPLQIVDREPEERRISEIAINPFAANADYLVINPLSKIPALVTEDGVAANLERRREGPLSSVSWIERQSAAVDRALDELEITAGDLATAEKIGKLEITLASALGYLTSASMTWIGAPNAPV